MKRVILKTSNPQPACLWIWKTALPRSEEPARQDRLSWVIQHLECISERIMLKHPQSGTLPLHTSQLLYIYFQMFSKDCFLQKNPRFFPQMEKTKPKMPRTPKNHNQNYLWNWSRPQFSSREQKWPRYLSKRSLHHKKMRITQRSQEQRIYSKTINPSWSHQVTSGEQSHRLLSKARTVLAPV